MIQKVSKSHAPEYMCVPIGTLMMSLLASVNLPMPSGHHHLERALGFWRFSPVHFLSPSNVSWAKRSLWVLDSRISLISIGPGHLMYLLGGLPSSLRCLPNINVPTPTMSTRLLCLSSWFGFEFPTGTKFVVNTCPLWFCSYIQILTLYFTKPYI